jgi:hypothetical protein
MDRAKLFKAERPAFYIHVADPEAFDSLFYDLRDAYADEDVSVWKIRGAKSRTIEAFFNEIGAALQLPYYFGETWDALSDLFYDRGWLPGTLFMVPDADQLLADADPRDMVNFVELLDKCNSFYLGPQFAASDTPGTGFHVLFQVTDVERTALENRLSAAGTEFASI